MKTLEEAARIIVYGDLDEAVDFKHLVKNLLSKLKSAVEKREMEEIANAFAEKGLSKDNKKWIIKKMSAVDIAMDDYKHLKQVFG